MSRPGTIIRRLLAGAAPCLFIGIGSLTAQGVSVPSVQFGALAYPSAERLFEIGFSTDRFTEHTKGSDSLAVGKGRRVPDYLHKRTDGFNTFHAAVTGEPFRNGIVMRVAAFAGWTGERPSRYLQNEFRHNDEDLQPIPVDEERLGRGAHGGATASIDHWFRSRASRATPTAFPFSVFTGMEGTVSSIYHEVVFRAGVRSHRWRIAAVEIPSVSLMVRKSALVRASKWMSEDNRPYADSVLTNTYLATTASVRIPFDYWFAPAGLIPAVEVGLTSSSGFFRGFESEAEREGFLADRAAGRTTRAAPRIEETYCSVAFQWGGGDVTLETYNDMCAQKDIGPSFGARVYFRWRNDFPARPR